MQAFVPVAYCVAYWLSMSENYSTSLLNESPLLERQAFSSRLRKALADRGYTANSPTQLARQFNARYSGANITVHAARKWIVGEAIPTQGKIRTLAEWLGVSAEWLRFGDENPETVNPAALPRITTHDQLILNDLLKLDDSHRNIVHMLIRQLVQINSDKSNGKER